MARLSHEAWSLEKVWLACKAGNAQNAELHDVTGRGEEEEVWQPGSGKGEEKEGLCFERRVCGEGRQEPAPAGESRPQLITGTPGNSIRCVHVSARPAGTVQGAVLPLTCRWTSMHSVWYEEVGAC